MRHIQSTTIGKWTFGENQEVNFMARTIQDNPSGWSRSLPGHTVEYSTGFAQPFYYGDSLTIAAGGNGTYTLTIDDANYIFFFDMINVTPQSYKEFSALIYINSVNYVAGSFVGYCNIPLRQNPSIQLISGDKIEVKVYNLDSAQHTFLVKCNGTKIQRPADYGKAPGAYFTAPSSNMVNGTEYTFTDASTYTPTSWEWNFGDGSDHSHDQNPKHTFAAAGTYNVTLKATNAYGNDTYALSITIIEAIAVDFSTFTEVDAGNVLTPSAAKIVGDAVPCNGAAYAYKDYTADYFNKIDVAFRVKATDFAGASVYVITAAFANAVGDIYPTAGYKVMVYIQNATGNVYLLVGLFNGGSDVATDTMSISLNTDYYLRVERAAGATTLTVKVYSDAARTVLIDTLSISNANLNTKFRYLYGLGSLNFSSATSADAESGDMVIYT